MLYIPATLQQLSSLLSLAHIISTSSMSLLQKYTKNTNETKHQKHSSTACLIQRPIFAFQYRMWPLTNSSYCDSSIFCSCCCCDSLAALLLSSIVQVEEVCDRSRVGCVSNTQVIGCEDRLRNDLLCVEWDVKLYTHTHFDSWTDALRSVVPLHTPDRHLICHWWCGPCNCSKANSDQNPTGREWYGLTEAADFQEVKYRVVKLQGLCLVQNSYL